MFTITLFMHFFSTAGHSASSTVFHRCVLAIEYCCWLFSLLRLINCCIPRPTFGLWLKSILPTSYKRWFSVYSINIDTKYWGQSRWIIFLIFLITTHIHTLTNKTQKEHTYTYSVIKHKKNTYTQTYQLMAEAPLCLGSKEGW